MPPATWALMATASADTSAMTFMIADVWWFLSGFD